MLVLINISSPELKEYYIYAKVDFEIGGQEAHGLNMQNQSAMYILRITLQDKSTAHKINGIMKQKDFHFKK